jgi:RP/EB family microtubule-associated protein
MQYRINGLLHLDYTRVEQCANGAAYCQIIDSLFTEEFPLKKVSFTAKSENHSIKNYKVLQQFFMQKGIDKTIDVDKVVSYFMLLTE